MKQHDADRIRGARWYHVMLVLYAPDFRRAYAAEMKHVFLESYRVVADGSLATRGRFWIRTLRDALINGMGSRVDALRTALRPPRENLPITQPSPRGSHLDAVLAGMRAIGRSPRFALLAAVVLGLGVGAVTTILSVVHATLVEPLPYHDPDRIVIAWGSTKSHGQLRDVVSGPVALELQAQNTTLQSLAAFKPENAVVIRDSRALVLPELTVTTEFFTTLGIEPFLGRWFTDAEGYSGAAAVTVVSHAFWRDALGADSAAVGRRIEVDGEPHLIVGVIAPDFFFPYTTPDIVVPLAKDVLHGYGRTSYDYWLVGRLQEGRTLAAASQDLNRILSTIAEVDPRLASWSILVEPMQNTVVAYVRPALLVLLVAVGFVWLIAVVNVANLLLIRLAGRDHALAIHRALGASRSRLAALLLGEGAAIGIVGFAGGVGLSAAALGMVRTLTPPTIPIPGSAAQVALATPTFGWAAVGFALLAAVFGFLVFSAPTVWKGTRTDGARIMRANSRYQSPTRSRMHVYNTLAGGELMTATLLLVGAGLSLRTMLNLLTVDSGMQAERVLTMYVGDLNDRSRAERVRFFDDVLREVARVPGVRIAGLNDYVPLQSEDDFEGVRFPDRPPPRPGEGPREEWRRVSVGYRSAAGISLVRGRWLTDFDDAAAPSVAVINSAFADKYYPNEDPVGQQILVTNGEYASTEIVGVVADVRRRGLDEDPPPVLYVPYQRGPRPNMALFVRTAGDPAALVEPVQAAIWRIDAGQPIDRVATLADVVRSSVGVPRLTMQITGGLATVALLLAAIGVLGVMAYSVRLRQHEIGIRVALGATPHAIRAMVVRHGAIITSFGLVGGLAAVLVLGRGLGGVLYGVSPADPVTLVSVGLLLGLVSLTATYLPARRATRVDPLDTLREG